MVSTEERTNYCDGAQVGCKMIANLNAMRWINILDNITVPMEFKRLKLNPETKIFLGSLVYFEKTTAKAIGIPKEMLQGGSHDQTETTPEA